MGDCGLRIGTVSEVNESSRQARVRFPDVDIISGWLRVIKTPPFIPAANVTQKTESTSGGSGESSFASHSHELVILPWFPKVGDAVLCLYDTSFNGDGYVIGGM